MLEGVQSLCFERLTTLPPWVPTEPRYPQTEAVHDKTFPDVENVLWKTAAVHVDRTFSTSGSWGLVLGALCAYMHGPD